MVLYRYCVWFFAPQGEKTTHKELNMIGKRKSQSIVFAPRGENNRQNTTNYELSISHSRGFGAAPSCLASQASSQS